LHAALELGDIDKDSIPSDKRSTGPEPATASEQLARVLASTTTSLAAAGRFADQPWSAPTRQAVRPAITLERAEVLASIAEDSPRSIAADRYRLTRLKHAWSFRAAACAQHWHDALQR